MRTKIIRTATFGAILTLPFALPQSRSGNSFPGVFQASTASADGTLNRLMRWTGYGWSCGYHACNNNGWGLRDGLPPVGNTAHKLQPLTPGSFEMVDPVHVVAQPASHWVGSSSHSHYQSPVMHHGYVEGVSAVPDSNDSVGGSLLVPMQAPASGSVQRYRSALPPAAPSKPSLKTKDREERSPSDVEFLPSPKGNVDPLDDPMFENGSAQLQSPRNRSAGKPVMRVVR